MINSNRNKVVICVSNLFAAIFMLYGPAAADMNSGADTGIININEASVNELAGLSGIGKTKAEAIIAYRSEHGKFESVDDIKKVKGIGKKTFKNISNQITAR